MIEIYCYMHSQIKILQTIMALPQNVLLIIGDMQETFTFRRQNINCNRPSTTTILESYPRFADFDKGKSVRGSFFTPFEALTNSDYFYDSRFLTVSKFLAAVIIVEAVSLRDKNFEILTVCVTLSRSSGIKIKISNGIELVKSLKDVALDETASF